VAGEDSELFVGGGREASDDHDDPVQTFRLFITFLRFLLFSLLDMFWLYDISMFSC